MPFGCGTNASLIGCHEPSAARKFTGTVDTTVRYPDPCRNVCDFRVRNAGTSPSGNATGAAAVTAARVDGTPDDAPVAQRAAVGCVGGVVFDDAAVDAVAFDGAAHATGDSNDADTTATTGTANLGSTKRRDIQDPPDKPTITSAPSGTVTA